MGIRKVLIASILAFVAACCAFAMTVDDMVAKAMENSVTIRTLEINRENTLLNKQISDADDVVSVTIKSGDVTLRKEKDEAMTRDPHFSFGPSVEVVLPEFNNNTISFGISNSTRIFNNSDRNSTSFTPYASYKKLINLDSFTDTREDIAKRTNELRLEQSYQKSILQFKNTVLQTIASILQSQISIKSQQVAYDRLVNDYDNGIGSGEVTKDSVKDYQSKMNLDSKRVALENAKDKLEKALENFKRNYGFDFEVPESVRAPEFSYEENPSGNTNVLLAELALETARQAVSAAEGTSDKLQLGANASTTMTKTRTSDDITTTAKASVSGAITGSHYSIGAEAGGDYTKQEIYPYITISGMWKNKTTKETDDLTLQTLKNKVILAQIDYDDALQSYKNECASLKESMEEFRETFAQFEISRIYNNMIYASTVSMHEKGLATDRELEDAELKVEADKVQLMIYLINALVIENNIAINEL